MKDKTMRFILSVTAALTFIALLISINETGWIQFIFLSICLFSHLITYNIIIWKVDEWYKEAKKDER